MEFRCRIEKMSAENQNAASAGRRDLIALVTAWLLLATGAIALARQNLSVPGLYYDEAVFGGLAKDFITGQHHLHTPGFELVTIFGRPFPLFVQFYLGALKSWMLMPALALFGSSLAVLRLTSLVWALLSALVFMLGVRRWLGLQAGIVAGAVLMVDPTFFFLGLLDWGAAISALFCRCAAFYLIVIWWQRRSAFFLFLAGLFLGLGVFNKVDFVAFIIGVAVAAACFYGTKLWTILRDQRLVVAATIGFLIGAWPMILKIPRIVSYVGAGEGSAGAGETQEKLHTLFSMYGGSYFYRLMDAGGLFNEMYAQPSPTHSLFGFVFVSAALLLAMIGISTHEREERRLGGFLLAGFALTTTGIFLLPGAVRIHHAVLAFPFPQLIIATAAIHLWQRKWSLPAYWIRSLILVVVGVLFASQLFAIVKTERLLNQTGGRGRWSNAFDAFCHDNKMRNHLTMISLDWGFNEQMAFLTNGPQLVEPFWAFSSYKSNLPPLPNKPNNVYLVHSPEYSLSHYDTAYLDAARDGEELATAQPYFDRQGRAVFYTIRFP